MAIPNCDVDTAIHQSLPDEPNDELGIGPEQLKILYDKAVTDLKAWINTYLVTGVNLHTAESAAKHIKESGSNVNGNYIKFDDGTMICLSPIDTSASGDVALTFPATFANLSIRIVGCANAPYTGVLSVSYSGATTTSVSLRVYKSDNTRIATTISVIAIGRWK